MKTEGIRQASSSSAGHGIWQVRDNAKAVAVSDGVIGMTFRKPAEGGLVWASLRHLGAKKEFLETLPATDAPLWRVAFRPPGDEKDRDERPAPGGPVAFDPAVWANKEHAELTSAAPIPVEVVSAEVGGKHGVVITWRGLSLGSEPGVVDVALSLGPGPRRGLVEWRLAVTNRSKRMGIWYVECPCITGLGSRTDHAQDAVGVPLSWGVRYRDPLARGLRYSAEYPSVWAAMQYACLWNQGAGLYLAAHDPCASHKSFHFETRPAGAQSTLCYWQRHLISDMAIPGKDYAMGFAAVVGVFDGDWYDASAIYRAWITDQAWCISAPIARNKSFPARLGEVDVWIRNDDLAPAGVAVQIKRFAEFMGVTCGLHYYNWHMTKFDCELPNYFPAREGFTEAVQDMRRAGIVVMPYINVRCWDPAVKNWAQAQAFATSNEQKEVNRETYAIPLAVMCPATSFWQEKVAEIVKRLFHECGADGVYMDQISSAPPVLCFDKSHGHKVGGGDFWWHGYHAMLDRLEKIRREVAPAGFFTTESNAESWNDKMWGYLTWAPGEDDFIPMYAVVYGGYVVPFGRMTGANDYANGVAAWKFAQQFVWGAQPGWMGPDLLDKAPKMAAFLRTLVRQRSRTHDYLLRGQMLRPATILNKLPAMSLPIAQFANLNVGSIEVPVVETATWRAPDGSIALVFANMAETEQKLRFRLDLGETGLAARELTLERLGAGAPTVMGKRAAANVFEEEAVVGALDALILVLRAKD